MSSFSSHKVCACSADTTQEFTAFCKEEIFDKLGMGHTSWSRAALPQGTPLADMVTWLAETYDRERLDRAWTTVAGAALALVRPAPGVSVRLPRPSDPSDERSLEEWGDSLAVSPRTLRRRVQAETGLNYRDWRRYLALPADRQP